MFYQDDPCHQELALQSRISSATNSAATAFMAPGEFNHKQKQIIHIQIGFDERIGNIEPGLGSVLAGQISWMNKLDFSVLATDRWRIREEKWVTLHKEVKSGCTAIVVARQTRIILLILARAEWIGSVI